MLPDIRVRQRDYLLEISRALTQELDLDPLLERILRITIEMLAGQAGLIVLRSEMGGWMVRVSEGIIPAFLDELKPLLQEIPDHEDPEEFEIPEVNRILNKLTFAASLGLLSGVGLPMVTQKKVLGVIFIFRSYPGVFSTNDRNVLSSFAGQAAIAVQNAQMYQTITTNKKYLDTVLDSAADGILIIGPNQVIDRCNPAFSRMISLPLEDIQGHPHEEIVEFDRLTHDIKLEDAIANGWPLSPHAQLYVEGDLHKKASPPLPVGITYAPVLNAEGKLQSIIATVRDITRFRQAEELKTTFISVISHELKTPVALIKGYVCTLEREDAQWDSEFFKESLKVIEEEADRLSELIENLLDATRLHAGGVNLKKTEFFIPDMANRLATRFQTQTKKHKIKVEFPKGFPTILADEGRIEQVINNLISNSIKYANEGVILLTGEAKKRSVSVCISDHGGGISPQDLPYVFDRFYRSADALRNKKGAGLGLYLAKSIVEAHKGSIWIDTDYTQGAKICFSLPIDEE
ncbi:MAG: PAS domain-containing protein [Chloroflexi bacterium]|nr:PAS domain-containing protein [Chloroflexota bacterium]